MKPFAPFLLCLAGCNLFGSVQASGRPVGEAYGGNHELRVLDVDSPLRREKKVPVISTPEVFAAYVPAHAERDIYFGDRWVFVRLKDSEWLTERLQDPDPPATGDAPPESLRLLRDANWDHMVIPHR